MDRPSKLHFNTTEPDTDKCYYSDRRNLYSDGNQWQWMYGAGVYNFDREQSSECTGSEQWSALRRR